MSSTGRASPDAHASPSRAGELRCVFIDASVHYVDQRGEHSGLLSESVDTQEDRCRLSTVSNNEQWLRAAVAVGDELIDLAQRSGDIDAWGCTSGHSGGANPGPNLMMHVIRAVTGRRPPTPAWGPLTRPEEGRWSVRRVFGYDIGEHAPSVAIWHLGFTQNPQFFPLWCEAITRGGSAAPVLILPDSPIMRDLARRWNAGERHQRGEGWRGDSIRDYLGSAAYIRTRVSAATDVDGSEIPGDRLVAALAFLRARHQLRISPFDLLRDPLLAAQLRRVEVEDPAWSRGEATNLALLRQRYDRSQRVHSWLAEARETLPVDVFGTGDSYQSSVETCLQTAERALATGEVAPVLISSWTGWAPSALDRGERPEVPATAGIHGRLVDWYRRTFELAIGYDLIDADWFRSREAWHAEAYHTFPGTLTDYHAHISAAERSLKVEPGRRSPPLEEVYDLSEWYLGVFRSAASLGLVQAEDPDNEVS